jgi:hypothetical protein
VLGHALPKEPPCIPQPEALQAQSFSFHGGATGWTWLSKSLTIGNWNQFPPPLLFLDVRGGIGNFSLQITDLVPLEIKSLFSKSHLISRNSVMVEWGLGWVPNGILLACITQEIPRVLVALMPGSRVTGKIYVTYCILHLPCKVTYSQVPEIGEMDILVIIPKWWNDRVIIPSTTMAKTNLFY